MELNEPRRFETDKAEYILNCSGFSADVDLNFCVSGTKKRKSEVEEEQQ